MTRTAGLLFILTLTACGGDVWPPPDAAWRARFANEVEARVGPAASTALRPLGEPETGADGIRRQTVALTNADGASYPAILLRPAAGADAPRPAILLVHGHNGPGENWVTRPDAPERALGAALAAAGFVVLAPDVRSFGGHRAPDGRSHDEDTVALQDAGDVFVRRAAQDVLGALRALRAEPDVDPSRVGLLGQSLGGVIALVVALSEAPDAVVVSGILMPFDRLFSRHNHACQHFPALREVGDMPALVAALAPTPVQIHFGAEDREFVERNEGRAAALEAIERWSADPLGPAPELVLTPGLGHAVDVDAQIAFFTRHLGP